MKRDDLFKRNYVKHKQFSAEMLRVISSRTKTTKRGRKRSLNETFARSRIMMSINVAPTFCLLVLFRLRQRLSISPASRASKEMKEDSAYNKKRKRRIYLCASEECLPKKARKPSQGNHRAVANKPPVSVSNFVSNRRRKVSVVHGDYFFGGTCGVSLYVFHTN